MKGTYWQKGEALDYLNSSDKKIENGDVIILGKRIGVAGDDILPGTEGAVHVSGVFSFQKADAAAISMGTEVYFAEDGITATEDAKTVKAGYAAAESAESDPMVYVKINA